MFDNLTQRTDSIASFSVYAVYGYINTLEFYTLNFNDNPKKLILTEQTKSR